MSEKIHSTLDSIHVIVQRIDMRTDAHSQTLDRIGETVKSLEGIKENLGTIAHSVEAALEPERGYVNQLIEVLASREKKRDWLPTLALLVIGAALLALVVATFKLDLNIKPNGETSLGTRDEARNK